MGIADLTAALASSRTGVVVVERTDLAVLELSGADVLRYLHAVSTQHTADLRAGDATRALLLSPKGKIEFAFRLAVLDGGVLLDTEAVAAPALGERLARFVLRYDVVVTPRPGACLLSLVGPGADEALAAAGLPPAPATPDRATVAAGLVAHRTELGVDLLCVNVAASPLAALQRAGARLAPLGLWEVERIERGLPRWGSELTDDVIAEEAGLLGSYVHLDKGCYPGQESVARVHNLGQVQRRLAGLRFEDPDVEPPSPGAALVTESGRRAGQLRGAVRHPDLGPIALAYVRRAVAAGTRVLVGDVAAIVLELPFPPEWRSRRQPV